MGHASSSVQEPEKVNGVVQTTTITENSSGTHLLEIHLPTAGLGLGALIGFTVFCLVCYTCYRQCKRMTRPKFSLSHRHQTALPTWSTLSPSEFRIPPLLAPQPSLPAPSSSLAVTDQSSQLNMLMLFARLQQQQQEQLGALSDEIQLLSSQARFSVISESPARSPPPVNPSTSTSPLPDAAVAAAAAAVHPAPSPTKLSHLPAFRHPIFSPSRLTDAPLTT